LVPLPEPVSSFGAAVSDGWLYVYGGHIGGEHEHSAANLSQNFRRIKLDGGPKWEELPMQMPLQGLALVAHEGKVYRIGGLNARNATKDDDEDLHSQAEFTVFDPATGKWQSLAPLPAPRSSHNAVVIDNKLYVVGGWHLHGQSPGEWQPDALVYDFAKPDAGWQKLPEPPFKRRAIAAGKWQGKLVVIGGMDENEKISRRVHLFDPQPGSWTEGPKLPGSGMMAFGTAACDFDGQIFVTGLQGVVYRLNESGSAWEEATRMATGRFFHQLVPTSDGRLLAVGGASRENHLADIESIGVP
jgi:N-acetylneuraminic acid mutarotase